MKKTLIGILLLLFFIGSVAPVAAERGSHGPRNKHKNHSGDRGHKRQFKQNHKNHSHTSKPKGVHKHRRSHKGHKSGFQKKYRSGHRDHKPKVAQQHRTAPHIARQHSVQKHRPSHRNHQPRFQRKNHFRSHVYRPHGVRKHRPGRKLNRTYRGPKYRHDYRAYYPRYGYRYDPVPRIYYPRPYPHGYRTVFLPRGFISFTLSGLTYYYASGNYYTSYGGYYTVVRPPIGALIPIPPPNYRIVTIDSVDYYLAGDVYYIWDGAYRGYRVVPPPEEIYEARVKYLDPLEDSLKLFIYPNASQDEEQLGRDRYECHQWAVGETDFDPSIEESTSEGEHEDYLRAMTACLEGRDYTVE